MRVIILSKDGSIYHSCHMNEICDFLRWIKEHCIHYSPDEKSLFAINGCKIDKIKLLSNCIHHEEHPLNDILILGVLSGKNVDVFGKSHPQEFPQVAYQDACNVRYKDKQRFVKILWKKYQ